MVWKDKVALITGSSKGIGKATALELGLKGVKIMLNGRSARQLEETRTELAAQGLTVHAWLADVGKPAEARQLITKTLSIYGKIDFLINNAGLSMRGTFADLVTDTVDSVLTSNLHGAIYPTLFALEALKASQGSVVFVSSLAGVRGFSGVSIYSAAKMALTALSQSLGIEMHTHGVHVGLIYLGFTKNDPDKTILTSQGEKVQHQRSHQLTQNQAALGILRVIFHKKRTHITTSSGRFLDFFQRHFPRLTEWIVRGSKGRIHSSKILKQTEVSKT